MRFDINISTQIMDLSRSCLHELFLLASDPRKSGSETSVVDMSMFLKLLSGCAQSALLHRTSNGVAFPLHFSEAHIVIKHLYSLAIQASGLSGLAAPLQFASSDINLDDVLAFHSTIGLAAVPAFLQALHFVTFVRLSADPQPLVVAVWALLVAHVYLQGGVKGSFT